MSDVVQQISELFRSQNTFLVLTHYRPDGDAVGSQLALLLMLQGLGKTVEAWNDDEVPTKFRFLPCSEFLIADVVVDIDEVLPLADALGRRTDPLPRGRVNGDDRIEVLRLGRRAGDEFAAR